MELHQLRYVAAVARTGNFSRAAEQCHVSQPALSQQILKLEDELGERLFERMKREVKLTAHGRVFLPRALRILEEVEGAKRDAMESNRLLRGTVTVGALPTIAPYLMPAVTMAFAREFPQVELIIQEDSTAQLLRLTRAYEVDLALVSRPIDDEQLEIRDLFSDELLLALPRSHRLTRKRALSSADLAEEKFIVMKEGHCLGEQVMKFCDRGESGRTKIGFRSAQLETIQAMVAAGLGISLVPAMAARKPGRNVPVYRSFVNPKPTRQIVAVWPKHRPLSRAAGELFRRVRPPP